jgi:hypothetical protein
MAFALTTESTIECPHHGTVKPSSSAKLTVGGNAVLLNNQLSGLPIEKCETVPETSKSITKCLTIQSESGGTAGKLSVGGVAVLLDSVKAFSEGMPPPPEPRPPQMIIKAGESKLQAV